MPRPSGARGESLKIFLISLLVPGFQLWADPQGHSTLLGHESRHLPHQVPFPISESFPTLPALRETPASQFFEATETIRWDGPSSPDSLLVLICYHIWEIIILLLSVDQVSPQHPVFSFISHSSHSHSHASHPDILLKLPLEDHWWPSGGQSNVPFFSLFSHILLLLYSDSFLSPLQTRHFGTLRAQTLRSDFLGSNPSSTIFSPGDFGQVIYCLNAPVSSSWKLLIISSNTGHEVDANIEFLALMVLAKISLSNT